MMYLTIGMLGLITPITQYGYQPINYILIPPAIAPKFDVCLISPGLTLTHVMLQAEVTQIVAITLKYCEML